MIGLIASAEASSALAPPMRPPFFRFSRVSSAPHTLVREARSCARATTAACEALPAARVAQSITMRPRPSVTCWLSITVTLISSATARAASSADCIVADRAALRLMATMLVAPWAASLRYAASNWPGDGAAVSGRVADFAHFAQNSAGVRSARSTYSWPSMRMVRGTISIPS